MNAATTPQWCAAVLDFWFEEVGEKAWFSKNEQLDAEIQRRFATLHQRLNAGSSAAIPATSQGHLAAIIVLDQFSRNMYRGTARAFASDDLALSIAQHTIQAGLDRDLATQQRIFLYMPYEHSEDLRMQLRSLELFASLTDPNLTSYAQQHHDIIARFGRFPHRNGILGRTSTAEELQFLQQHPGF